MGALSWYEPALNSDTTHQTAPLCDWYHVDKGASAGNGKTLKSPAGWMGAGGGVSTLTSHVLLRYCDCRLASQVICRIWQQKKLEHRSILLFDNCNFFFLGLYFCLCLFEN